MPRKTNYTLTEEQMEAIEEAMAHDERREVVQRATCIRLLHLGYPPEETAEMMAVGYSSIYRWHQRWREHGVEGLADQARSGRPRKADAEYLGELEEALEHEPAEYGYGFAIWTIDRLARHLAARTGVELSGERLRVLMQEQGYVYRRPKHDLKALQDQQARADAMALLDDLKKERSPKISNSSLWTKRP